MDIGRYGAFASSRTYLKDMTAQFYKRRFVLSYPNEQLPAGRPLKTAPVHDMLAAEGARCGVSWGLELPLYFVPDGQPFTEQPTLRRSDADPFVAAESRVAREQVVSLDTTAFSRFEVTGPGARSWLDGLLACAIPSPGRARLAPMLSPSGRLMGDLTVFNWDGERFWLMGSYYLRQWHMRWFEAHRPDDDVGVTDISDAVTGIAIAGPRSRDLLARLTEADVSAQAFPFMACRSIDVGLSRARVGRLSVVGELGYEINVAASEQPALYRALREAGRDLGLRPVGYNAVNSLRLEKSFGIWSKEYTWAATPGSSGLDRFVAFDKGEFVGREAALRERKEGPARRLVTLAVEATDADASGFEPVWAGRERVGYVTSGGYGHTVGKSLAMAYLDAGVAEPGTALDVHIVGERRRATIIPSAPVDPAGARMRA